MGLPAISGGSSAAAAALSTCRWGLLRSSQHSVRPACFVPQHTDEATHTQQGSRAGPSRVPGGKGLLATMPTAR